MLQADAAAAAAFGGVGHDHIAVNHRVRPRTVRKGRGTLGIGHRALANSSIWAQAHDHQAAAVGRECGVRALVEDDPVVRDVAVIDEPDVGDATAVARAQVAAYPVELELVVIGAIAEHYPSC